jgi:inner membrane protein
MDIVTHTLSGLAAGTAVAAFIVHKKGLKKSIPILIAGLIGGFLPDIDAISLWSGFDATIGKFFALSAPGQRIYFSTYMLSHHGAMHSVAAAIFLTLSFLLTSYAFQIIYYRNKAIKNILLKSGPKAFAFFLGYLFHLLGDLPTPGYVWGGIRLWWPSSSYSGGTNQIWWWNNYDIFLLVLITIIINLTIIPLIKNSKIFFLRFIPSIIVVLMIIFSVIQINSRTYTYLYKNYRKEFSGFEKKSLKEQQRILGIGMYKRMRSFDKKTPFPF